MASWLKAAEDLLEVVDRRAKLAVGERADEQSDFRSPASNTQGSQAKRTRSITKAQKLLLTNESQKASDTTSEQTYSMVSNSDERPDKERATLSSENKGNPTAKSAVQTSSEQYSDNEIDVSYLTQILSLEPLEKDIVKHNGNQGEVSASVRSAEAPMSTSNGNCLNENATDVLEDHPASLLTAKEIDVISEDHLNDSGQTIKVDLFATMARIETETSLSVLLVRVADERTTKAAELEQKVALLEVECATLNQELQDMEAHSRRGQKKSPEEATQMIQAWQEEVECARQGQREAESKLSSLEAEVQKMRVEMAAMKREAERYSRQEHMELEKRCRELTDLLYYKQTQLEAMASEKAAAEFQLEKEIKRLQEAQIEAERSRVSCRAPSSWEEDTEMKALEPLPLNYRQMAAASIQLQKAAKLLDSGALRTIRFLWRYPTARVILLFYLVFVHLFLMYLMQCLQEQADNISAREDAAVMGFP